MKYIRAEYRPAGALAESMEQLDPSCVLDALIRAIDLQTVVIELHELFCARPAAVLPRLCSEPPKEDGHCSFRPPRKNRLSILGICAHAVNSDVWVAAHRRSSHCRFLRLDVASSP